MAYETRLFMIFETSEISSINFDEVMESSAETLRLNVSGSRTFVKWDGFNIDDMPSSVNNLTTKLGPYTYNQMKLILALDEWSNPIDGI
jgi:hypothetical protein